MSTNGYRHPYAQPMSKLAFSKLYTVDKATGCYNWSLAINTVGYGVKKYKGKTVTSHRLAWELTNGIITTDELVLHKCNNRRCVNINHLYLGTHQDNMDDMTKANRQIKGAQHPLTILTEDDVIAIRADKRFQKDIAKDYQINFRTVSQIQRYETWKHVA